MNILNISRILTSLCTLSCLDCSWSSPQWNDIDEMKLFCCANVKTFESAKPKIEQPNAEMFILCVLIVDIRMESDFYATIREQRTQRCR